MRGVRAKRGNKASAHQQSETQENVDASLSDDESGKSVSGTKLPGKIHKAHELSFEHPTEGIAEQLRILSDRMSASQLAKIAQDLKRVDPSLRGFVLDYYLASLPNSKDQRGAGDISAEHGSAISVQERSLKRRKKANGGITPDLAEQAVNGQIKMEVVKPVAVELAPGSEGLHAKGADEATTFHSRQPGSSNEVISETANKREETYEKQKDEIRSLLKEIKKKDAAYATMVRQVLAEGRGKNSPALLMQQITASTAEGSSNPLSGYRQSQLELVKNALVQKDIGESDAPIVEAIPETEVQWRTGLAQTTTDNKSQDDLSSHKDYSKKSDTTDWSLEVRDAIERIEREVGNLPNTKEEAIRHRQPEARLRMLYLISGRMKEAQRPITGISTSEQEFWKSELFALNSFLDREKVSDESTRAALATRELRRATARLGEIANLDVHNLVFVRRVDSYGIYTPFNKDNVFLSGQELLLYAEVDNFKSKLGDSGFETKLKSRFDIRSSTGEWVTGKECDLVSEICRNRRRDFFVRFRIHLPKEIKPGEYLLELTVEDLIAEKTGKTSARFTVK